MSDSDNALIYLYTTSGCHLCEQAEAVVAPHLSAYSLQIEPVEIADDDALLDFYGDRIPVIRLAGCDVELGWPFDEALAKEYIEAMLAKAG